MSLPFSFLKLGFQELYVENDVLQTFHFQTVENVILVQSCYGDQL